MNSRVSGLMLAALVASLHLTACTESGKDAAMEESKNEQSANVDPSTLTREERIAMRKGLQAERTLEMAPQPESSAEPAVTGEVPDEILDAIMLDLEGRTGADRSAFKVTRGEAKTWNDGSLGCPDPGQMYTQAIVEGYHVVIEHNGIRNDYRAAANGSFRLCEGFNPAM